MPYTIHCTQELTNWEDQAALPEDQEFHAGIMIIGLSSILFDDSMHRKILRKSFDHLRNDIADEMTICEDYDTIKLQSFRMGDLKTSRELTRNFVQTFHEYFSNV